MIIYNNSNTFSFRNHIVSAQKMIIHSLFLTQMGKRILRLTMMPPHLTEVWRPLYNVKKYQIMSTITIVQ